MDEEERRIRDRRVKDIEDKLCTHIQGADERWESIEVHIQEMKDILKSLDIESLTSVSEVIKGGITLKKFIIGLASIVVALSAIGGSIIWLVKSIK